MDGTTRPPRPVNPDTHYLIRSLTAALDRVRRGHEAVFGDITRPIVRRALALALSEK